jgi:hypothetical protein
MLNPDGNTFCIFEKLDRTTNYTQTLELMNQNKEGQAVFAIGTAIRMAQSLGLHRALSAHKAAIELTFVEKNYHLRSCIWWTCYCLDK